MSRTSRFVLILFLFLFAWMVLSDWSTDSVRMRAINSVISALMMTFAIGLAAPSRFILALRFVAGAIGIAYLLYFAGEVWALLSGQSQPIRAGQPSVLMAGFGLLVFGIPALIFAFSGSHVGVFRAFSWKEPQPDPDEPGT